MPRSLAFAVSSFYCGVAGALMALVWLGSADTEAFGLILSFEILFMIIIGGLGSMLGSFLGAAFIVLLPIALTNAPAWFGIAMPIDLAKHLEVIIFGGCDDNVPTHVCWVYDSVLGEIRGTPSVPRAHLDLSFTGLRWDRTFLGDARAYVRLTDRSDPWVREAAQWDEVPENEPCAHARYGLARGRWRPDPPIRTIDGPAPALDTPMA